MSRYRTAAAAMAPWLLLLTAAPTRFPARQHPPAGRVEYHRYRSPALGVSKAYAVYLPPGYDRETRRRYPVVYLLHGYGGSEREWIERGAIGSVADSLIAAGMAKLILVFPDGDNSFFVDWTSGIPWDECAGDRARAEPAEDACVRSANYATWIARDLVGQVDRTWRTRAGRGGRAVAGESMGGLGALTLALTHPGVFAAAASLSGVAAPLLLTTPAAGGRMRAASMEELEQEMGRPLPGFRRRMGVDTSRWWPYDPELAARRLVARRGPLPALWLVAGDRDGYARQSRALHASLTALGVAHEFHEAPGDHEWRFFRDQTPAMLTWLADQLSRPGGAP